MFVINKYQPSCSGVNISCDIKISQYVFFIVFKCIIVFIIFLHVLNVRTQILKTGQSFCERKMSFMQHFTMYMH